MMKNVKVNGKWDILLPDHRAARPEWHTEKGWERKRLDHMSENIGDGDVVYYIGAEEGEMPALCQMWGAEVVLFEPNHKVWPNIKAIWEANKLDAPWIWKGFASDKDSGLALHQNFGGVKGEIITDHGFMELRNRNAPEIKIDTLNDMLSYDPGIKITAISLDVEGSEWHVLRGAEKTLRELHPKIYLSGHDRIMKDHWGTKLDDLRKWIIGLGYEETLIEDSHETHLYYEKAENKVNKKVDLK